MSKVTNRPTGGMTGREWAMLLALAAAWGGSFFFNGIAVRELPSFTLVWLRVAIAAAALLSMAWLLRIRLPTAGGTWAALGLMGLLNNALPFALIVWGQHHIASGLASILNATTPVFTILAAHCLTQDEKLNIFKLAGVVAGLVGATVLIGFDVLQEVGAEVLAQLACLAAALSYALAGIFGRRFRHMGISPLATAAGQVTTSTLILLPVMLLVDQPWRLAMPEGATIGAVLAVGLLSTALAYVLYFRILAVAGATNLLLVTFLIPVVAILLGALFLGETLLPRHLLGMSLIGLGLACIDRRLPRLLGASVQARER
ncbi:DMT family transporter [Geminicoccus roseus]|uniref:DMT family transporter n=1 Tax=Geminicoccus roseus TaxID=404900 RepID=UPI0003F6E704|nr:DMT family transporter [Geminicoccus roseus]